MIRYAVLTVLMFYFAGAEVIQPIVPPVVDVATREFHKSVNKQVGRFTRPAVDMVFSPFRGAPVQERGEVRGTIPPEERNP